MTTAPDSPVQFATPSRLFQWCAAHVNPETAQLHRWYRNYYAVAGSDEYLWATYDQRFAELMRAVRPGLRVLEVGCGAGIESYWVGLQGASVVGIDINTQFNKAGRHIRKLLKRELNLRPDVELRRLNLLEMPDDETFDLIYMKEVLHHLEPRDSVIPKIASLLRPGGQLIVLEPNALNPMVQIDMMRKRQRVLPFVLHQQDKKTGDWYFNGDERLMRPATIRRLFRGVGIEGRTRLFRLLPTRLSRYRTLSRLAGTLERRAIDRMLPPLCVHCVFHGQKLAGA
jgi:2-polyprenyl-3-methyl-5-hydroxy-6-metoxy-1,4-benzoquinol methylase